MVVQVVPNTIVRAAPQPYSASISYSSGNSWASAVVAVVLIAAVLVGLAMLFNGGSVVCDATCWAAKQKMIQIVSTTDRAKAVAANNAVAGFGTNDGETNQTAVLGYPPRKATPAPTTAYIAPPPVSDSTPSPSGPHEWTGPDRVCTCLQRLGLVPGRDFWSEGTHVILAPPVKEALDRRGLLGRAAACVH